MTNDERAAQLWPLLAFAARNQQILSYKMVEGLTGLPRQAVGGNLSPIQEYCKHNKLPPLTCLVVNEEEGFPGIGFNAAKLKELFAERARVFVFDWLSHGNPFPARGNLTP